ncbi:MAG: hypothetical protein K2I27_01440 [Bacteroides sp.]|nr:hypothetical protein [Bacteroides sp.]
MPFLFSNPDSPICFLSDPYQGLFGFGRSSDKLHSLGPKNVRRTSEETPKKLWSR